MGETLAILDTFYVTNYVLLMTKRIYHHVYQGNSQGSGNLNDYSINNVQCFFVPKGEGNK